MKNYTKKTLITYWQHSKKYKISFLIMVVSVIGASSTNAIVPLFFKKFFDILTIEQNRDSAFAQMFNVLMIILVIEMFHWVFWRLNHFSTTYFQTHVIADLDNSSFEKIHQPFTSSVLKFDIPFNVYL